MRIINNADREIHFRVQGDASKTLWEGDLSQGATTEKPISEEITFLTTTFKTDPPQVPSYGITDITGKDTITIDTLYCYATFRKG